MNQYPISYWHETVADIAPRTRLSGAIDADIAIIGGGLCGLSTAFYLKREHPGLRVAVLESDVCGYGASGRSAGVAKTPFGLRMEITRLRFGTSAVREGHDFMRRAVEHVGELVNDFGVQCDYRRSELLIVATAPKGVRRLQNELKLARRIGLDDTHYLDAAETRRRLNSPTYLGGRVEPHCALVNPAQLVCELRRLAEAEGAEIYEESPVVSVEAGSPQEPVLVNTAAGQVRAGKLLFATNAYTRAFPQLASKQVPIGTYIILTAPLSPSQMASIGWQNREGIEDSPKLMTYYRLTSDNRLLIGGSDVSIKPGTQFPADHEPAIFNNLEAHIAKTFPALRGIPITHRWGGSISIAMEMVPAFGWLGSDRRIAYSLGCNGHGLAMMAYSGQLLRDLLLEKKTALTELFFVNRTVIPWPPEPLRFALAQTMRRYMHLEYNDAQKHVRQNARAAAEFLPAG